MEWVYVLSTFRNDSRTCQITGIMHLSLEQHADFVPGSATKSTRRKGLFLPQTLTASLHG